MIQGQHGALHRGSDLVSGVQRGRRHTVQASWTALEPSVTGSAG